MKSGCKQTQVGVIPEEWEIGVLGTGNAFWQCVLTIAVKDLVVER